MGVSRCFVKSPSTQSLLTNESEKLIQAGVAGNSAGTFIRIIRRRNTASTASCNLWATFFIGLLHHAAGTVTNGGFSPPQSVSRPLLYRSLPRSGGGAD